LKYLEEARFEKKWQIAATMKLICLITDVNSCADASAACGPVGIWVLGNFAVFLLPPILAKKGIQGVSE
jgi:hypothetical protein